MEIEAMVSIPEKYDDTHYIVKPPFDHNCLLVGNSCGKLLFEFDVCKKEFKEVNDLGGYAVLLGANHFLAKAEIFKYWFEVSCRSSALG